MLRIVCAGLVGALLVGCTTSGTQERPMRDSEKTVLSLAVTERLDESEDGQLDVREHADIKCERFKITGSHMVHRVCFTLAEEDGMGRTTRDRFERIINDTPRPKGELPGGN